MGSPRSPRRRRGLVDTDQVAEELVEHVSATPFPLVGRVTISCGVSKFCVAEEGLSVLKRADRALYREVGRAQRSVMLESDVMARV